MHLPCTALQHVTELITPSQLINEAVRYAKDNMARTMRWYTLGWGMSNSPHNSTIVVGRDTGWMCLGTDYVAPWFAPEALAIFRDRQKPNGQILEYVDMESGHEEDYGLNVSDNTPLYLWAVWRHWRHFADDAFRADFLASVTAAAGYLAESLNECGLLSTKPAGVNVHGISSWRNIIPDAVCAGEVTEINCLASMALRAAAELTEDPRYLEQAQRIADAVNRELWSGATYALNRFEGGLDCRPTGDLIFPVLTGIAPPERAAQIVERLQAPDFWTDRGLRTLPTSHPNYHPSAAAGLLGGSWPNLTLWYAAAVAPIDPDRALAALEMIARPAVERQPDGARVTQGEFPEYFDGETGVNHGMALSPWVAPTLVWAVMEGLLGLDWRNGAPVFRPHWPSAWTEVSVRGLPCAGGREDFVVRREAEAPGSG